METIKNVLISVKYWLTLFSSVAQAICIVWKRKFRIPSHRISFPSVNSTKPHKIHVYFTCMLCYKNEPWNQWCLSIFSFLLSLVCFTWLIGGSWDYSVPIVFKCMLFQIEGAQKSENCLGTKFGCKFWFILAWWIVLFGVVSWLHEQHTTSQSINQTIMLVQIDATT